MRNRYVYTFLKDGYFRSVCLASVVGIIICGVLVRVDRQQVLQLSYIHGQQMAIAQIPELKTKIAMLSGNPSGLAVTGIILDAKRPMAVINGTLVKAGEEIDGQRVVAISAHDVRVCNTAIPDKCAQLFIQQ